MRLLLGMMGWHSTLHARMIRHPGFRNCSILDVGRWLSVITKCSNLHERNRHHL